MKIIKAKDLDKKEVELLEIAHNAAEKTLSKSGDRLGAAILDDQNNIFSGAAIARMRAADSTCAERMALDNLLFNKNSKIKKVIIIGKVIGTNKNHICTPCGNCRQIFQEQCQIKKIKDIDFIISNWGKTRIVRTKLSELFPMAFQGEGGDYK